MQHFLGHPGKKEQEKHYMGLQGQCQLSSQSFLFEFFFKTHFSLKKKMKGCMLPFGIFSTTLLFLLVSICSCLSKTIFIVALLPLHYERGKNTE